MEHTTCSKQFKTTNEFWFDIGISRNGAGLPDKDAGDPSALHVGDLFLQQILGSDFQKK